MNFYPYLNPIILTDDIFQKYGGDLTKASYEQRQLCYQAAEEVASDDLDTFLLPTIVTGTYQYAPRVKLDSTYVSRVLSARFYDVYGNVYWDTSGTTSGYMTLFSQEYGLLDFHNAYLCGICGTSVSPNHVDIVYEAGFPTGVANSPKILTALTIYADIMMNEIVGYGNEAPGDIGIQQYNNQEYRETRITLFRSNFGSSPRALFASKQLNKYRLFRASGI